MTFRTALAGLNAASTDLSVTANNIANVATTGFKLSRTEFADVFSVSPFGLARTSVGSGARVSNIAQQFSQGNIEFSDNPLDLAISGNGFFRLSDRGAAVFSRAGNFSTNREGFVLNPAGQRLQVYPPIPDNPGVFDTGRLVDLQIVIGESPPQATENINLGLNLPANATQPVTVPLDPDDPTSYNHSTSLTVYDSLGIAHIATYYFARTANPNEWDMDVWLDGTPATNAAAIQVMGATTTITFDANGALATPAAPGLLPVGGPPGFPVALTNGANALDLTFNLAELTQFGESFSVSELFQDGFTTGRLTSLETSPTGVVFARFTNGQSEQLGQVALASFASPQSLQKLGDNAWGETFESGQPLLGTPGSSSLGLIQSGALEASNVDLTEQLVNMITAQRNFQANAQMITTQDQVTQAVLNIR